MLSRSVAGIVSEFQSRREQGSLTPDVLLRLAGQAAEALLNDPSGWEAPAQLLCELATLPGRDLAQAGAAGVFRHVVEPLADAFEPASCDLYVRFMARVLAFCRSLPEFNEGLEAAGLALDRRLRNRALLCEQDLIHRAEGLRTLPSGGAVAKAPQKIFVLSRVTLGADIAITSVVLARMMREFPAAEVILLGGNKNARLFAGESRVRARIIEYPRNGSLLERLAAWAALEDVIAQEARGLGARQYLVVDPDSRFTQLGLLPVTADARSYLFFDSRRYTAPGIETLSRLIAAWLDEAFGARAGENLPWVALPPEAQQAAQAIQAERSGNRWASVNLGVGDNPAKRIPDPFEKDLLLALLQNGWKIILDKGAGEEESARTGRLLRHVAARGWTVGEIEEGCGFSAARSADILAWQGSLAGFGALIATTQLYAGYDSAGQHLAAALGVKAVDIFSGFRSDRMVERWQPAGRAAVRTIVVDPHAVPDPQKILAAVLEAAR